MVALADVLRGWCSHWVRVGRWIPAYAGMTWWDAGMAWWDAGMTWWDEVDRLYGGSVMR